MLFDIDEWLKGVFNSNAYRYINEGRCAIISLNVAIFSPMSSPPFETKTQYSGYPFTYHYLHIVEV